MEVHYSDSHQIPTEIIKLIKDHALSCRMVKNETISAITLIEGKTKVSGGEKVKEHLLFLIDEVKQGWYCNC